MAGIAAYKAGSFLARTVPDGVATGVARAGGFAAGLMAGDAGTIVGRNLERVYGRPLSDIEKKRKIAETFEQLKELQMQDSEQPPPFHNGSHNSTAPIVHHNMIPLEP